MHASANTEEIGRQGGGASGRGFPRREDEITGGSGRWVAHPRAGVRSLIGDPCPAPLIFSTATATGGGGGGRRGFGGCASERRKRCPHCRKRVSASLCVGEVLCAPRPVSAWVFLLYPRCLGCDARIWGARQPREARAASKVRGHHYRHQQLAFGFRSSSAACPDPHPESRELAASRVYRGAECLSS